MTSSITDIVPLADIALGDIVTLPDGRSLTARARVSLPNPCGTMSGFIVAGELDVLLSLPPSVHAPINVYVPTPQLPVPESRCRTVWKGATRYWAPHAPAVGGAMGELLYRVLEVRGQVDPIVLIYRGSEMIVFIKASFAYPQDLKVLTMDRGVDNETPVTRYAAVVREDATPHVNPAPARQPTHAPATKPARVPAQTGRTR
jgi:hypothetical protein